MSGAPSPAPLVAAMLSALPERPERLQEAAARVPDWDAFLECAARHRVASVVFRALDPAAVPAGVRERFRRGRLLEQLRMSRLRRALAEALSALDAARVPVAALKGPVFAERFYPDPSLRASSDIDLLVQPRDVDAGLVALACIGYRPDSDAPTRYIRRHAHELTLERPDAPPIDLHFRAYAELGAVLPVEELLDRASRHDSAVGAPALVLSPEDELLFLCAHAAKHPDGLVWLFDLKLMIGSLRHLDWPLLERRARASGLRTAVAFALAELERWLGVRTPFPSPGAWRTQAVRRLRGRASPLLAGRKDGRELPGVELSGTFLLYNSLLCDRVTVAARMIGHRLAWAARRRARRRWPAIAPEEWGA